MTPCTVTLQAPLSMGFSRQEYWSGLPFPPPGDLPNSGIKPRSCVLQVDSLLSEPPGKPKNTGMGSQPLPSPGDLPNPGIEPRSPALQGVSLLVKPPGKPKNTGMGSLSLHQGIFLTQESNQGLLHCSQIVYHPLSCQGSPKLT